MHLSKRALLLLGTFFLLPALHSLEAAEAFMPLTDGIAVLSRSGNLLGFFRLPLIPNDLDILPDKNEMVVATQGPLIVMGGDGRIVATLPWTKISDVDVLQPDGSQLLLCSMDKRRIMITNPSGGDRDATRVVLQGPGDADLLPNGHLLITDTLGNRVVEVDKDDRIVWEYSQGLLHPWDAERLADGTTAIADFDHHRVLIVNTDGSIRRPYTDFEHPRRITAAENGDLFIADSDRQRIVVLHTDGTRSDFAKNLNRVVAVAPLGQGQFLAAVEAWFRPPSVSPAAGLEKKPSLPWPRLILLSLAALALVTCWFRIRLQAKPDGALSWRSSAAATSFLAALICQYRLAAGKSLDYPWTYPAALIILCLAIVPAVRELQIASPFAARLRERLGAPPEPLGLWRWLWVLAIFLGGALCFGLRYQNVAYSKILLVWSPFFLLSLLPVWNAVDCRLRISSNRQSAIRNPQLVEFLGLRWFLPFRNCELLSERDATDAKCNSLFLLVFLLSIPALCFRLEDFPTSVHGDCAEVALEGIAFREAEPLHFFHLGWYQIPALFFLYPAAVMRWFGDNVWGMRLSDVFMGLFTLPFFYGVLRRLYDSRVAVTGVALLAGCAYFIHFSRLGVGYNQTAFWTVVVFYLFLRAVETGSSVWYSLCGLSIGFSFYTYQASRIHGILVAASWLALQIAELPTAHCQRWWLFRRDWSRFLLLCGVAWLVLSPLLGLYALYPDSLNSRTRDVSIFGEAGREHIHQRYGLSKSWREMAWEQTKRGIGAPVAWPDGSPYLNNKGYEGILEPGTAVLFLCGVGLFLATIGAPGSHLPALWLFPLLILGGAMTINAPSYQRYISMTPIMIMFAAPMLLALGESLVPWPQRETARKALIATMVACICFSGVDRYFYGMMRLKQPVDEWTRIARYVAERGPANYTYMFGTPYVFFGYGTIRFIAQGCRGEDVPDPNTFLSRRVLQRGPVSFVFVFDRQDYLPRVRELYPGGVEIRHPDAEGAPAFVSYHTAL